jgi:rubrerythrin
MNVYDYVIKMEQDGEKFYRDLAARVSNRGLIKILTMIADDEVKHQRIFTKLKSESYEEMVDTKVLPDAKNVFETIEIDDVTDDTEQIALYEEAARVEAESAKFYIEKADELESDAAKKLFLRIAEEEKKHKHLLENIIDFVKRPREWVENAMFSTLDEY